MSNELHDTVTGQFAPKDSDPSKTTKVEEDRLSPWRKESERLLDCIEESYALGGGGLVDVNTVALVLHIQQLKRV